MAFDRFTLEPRWQLLAGKSTQAPMKASDNLILVSSSSGLHAIESVSGKIRWQQISKAMLFSATVAAGVAYLTDALGVLQAIESSSGELLWKKDLPAVDSSLVEVEGRLVLNGLDHHLYGLDSQSDNLLWTKPLHESLAVPLILQQEKITLNLGDGRLIELDNQNGKHHEVAQVTGNPVTTPYIQGNSIIVFIKSFGTLKSVIFKRRANNNPKTEI